MKIRVKEEKGASKVKVKETNLWKDALYRLMKNRMAIIGGVIVIALCITAIFAPLVAPYAYDEGNLLSLLMRMMKVTSGIIMPNQEKNTGWELILWEETFLVVSSMEPGYPYLSV